MPLKPLLLETSVTANPYGDGKGNWLYFLKIQTRAFELNVRVRPDEVEKFERVRRTPWVKGSVRIGESAGSPAFWCVGGEGEESVSILVGSDDECWDLAVSLPPDTIDVIRREIANCPLPGDGA
jgi:hypothetical protein